MGMRYEVVQETFPHIVCGQNGCPRGVTHLTTWWDDSKSPRSEFATSSYCCEEHARAFAKRHGIAFCGPTTIVRETR
jgi:hypothetical protein